MRKKVNIDDCTVEIPLYDYDVKDGIISKRTNNRGKIVYQMKDGTYRIIEVKPPTFKD